jgi:CRISPR-associated protein Cas8a1/Csx13
MATVITALPCLTLDLHAPGMTILHRAGLGGLACTLRYIERAYENCILPEEELPGWPWDGGRPPWHVEPRRISLEFGTPEGAREFLKRLFRIGFGIKDGLIYLPGVYPHEPSLAVRAELQAGMVLTFLQHGKARRLAKEATVLQHDPAGDGSSLVTVEYKRCSWFKHQDGWQQLVDGEGCLAERAVEVIGPLNPGAVVRHVAFTTETRIEEPPALVLPLYFALVGCLSLPVNRGVGVLVAPDVEDLVQFARDRPLMTPASPRECRIAGAGDAALQAQVRLLNRGLIEGHGLPACYAMRFQPTTWSTQQKSRVLTLHSRRRDVPRHESDGEDERLLHRFAVALSELRPRLLVRRPRDGQSPDGPDEVFWIDSVVRPLIADNLVNQREWFEGFSELMTAIDPGSKRPLREAVAYEGRGLHAMILTITEEEQALFVRAIHRAISLSLGRIRADTDGDGPLSQATLNRWDRFHERLRLSLVGAKTADQCRNAVCTLFGKAGNNRELQGDAWQRILPLFSDRHWRKARDLALLAQASYTSPEGQLPSAGESAAEQTD